MKEYRLLDQKRAAQGLTPDEEARFARLRDLVGSEAAGAASGGGFDVNAAAARLRESLLPAGLRNRPPPEPVPEPDPSLAFAEEPALETGEPLDPSSLASAWQDATPAPLEGAQAADPYFDPASLGLEGAEPAQAWDPNAAAYDPNAAAYDPNAVQAWDPNAEPYDPNAAAAYDPSAAQTWDPGAQPYDPNAAAFDPNAAQAWDPGAQPYDPNAAAAYDANAGQGWDPNAQSYDPNATAGWDPNAAYDPNAGQGWDPNAQSYDPSAAAAFDPNAAQAFDPNALPGEGDALAFDPAEQPLDLGAEPAPDAAAGLSADAGWETGAMPEAGAGGSLAAVLDLAASDPSAEPAVGLPGDPLEPLSLGSYDELDSVALAPEAAEPDGGLGSALPFDGAAADLGAGEPGAELGLGGELASQGPVSLGAYDDLAGFERAPPPDDLPADDPGFRAAAAGGAGPAGWQPDGALEEGFHLESSGSFELAETEEPAPQEPVYAAHPDAAPEPPEEAVEVMELDSGELAADADVSGAGDVALQDAVEGALPWEKPDAAHAAEDATYAAVAPAAAPAAEELPTIDGEEILEELPAEDAAPPPALDFEPLAEGPSAAPPPPAQPLRAPPPAAAAAAAAAAAPAPPPAPPAPEPAGALLEGVHRVVVHTLEGQVKRGVLESPDLAAAVLGLAPQPGASAEVIGTNKVKAIFFMLAPGEKAPAPEGNRVRVTFRDGRQVAGFSPDYREDAVGFFMVPADTRTNTGRIWVYRSAVRQVSIT